GIKAKIRPGVAKLHGREISPRFRITFHADASQPVFRIARKQAVLPVALKGRCRTLVITSCEEVDSVPTKCIAVDAPDRLYLAGHGCVPTHNTALLAMLLLAHLVGPEARRNAQLYSTALSRDQAALLFALAAKMARMSRDLNGLVRVVDSRKKLFC